MMDDEIDELKKKLALDVDAKYGMASSEHLMTEKEHFEVWDKMFMLESKKQQKCWYMIDDQIFVFKDSFKS